MKLSVKKSHKTTVPLKTKASKITHVGVYPRQEPIGWSRLYQHLWIQAINELGFSEDDVKTKGDDIENWVIDSLDTLKSYSPRINPDNINFDDVSMVLADKVENTPFIPYDESLKNDHDDDWFYNHESKYQKFFNKEIPVLEGGFNGWWKVIGENDLINSLSEPLMRKIDGDMVEIIDTERTGSFYVFFRDTSQKPLPLGRTVVTIKMPNGEIISEKLAYDGILILNKLKIGSYKIIKVEVTNQQTQTI